MASASCLADDAPAADAVASSGLGMDAEASMAPGYASFCKVQVMVALSIQLQLQRRGTGDQGAASCKMDTATHQGLQDAAASGADSPELVDLGDLIMAAPNKCRVRNHSHVALLWHPFHDYVLPQEDLWHLYEHQATAFGQAKPLRHHCRHISS